MTTPMVSTYSMWNSFRNCRKQAELRYLQHLLPLERDRNLHYGSLIHDCLQLWHTGRDLAAVLALIDRLCPNRIHDENQRLDAHLATAMMKAYASRYAAEDFEVVALEKTFEGPIVNPATGAASRSFVLAGKVDGIVRIGDEHYLLENKTTSQLNSDYLERLWTDFQITIYAYYVEQTMGIPITGILYNILVKAKLQQSKGETEEDSRRAAQNCWRNQKRARRRRSASCPRRMRSFSSAWRKSTPSRPCCTGRCCTCRVTASTSSALNSGN